ncbi:hypothetical protein KUL17_10380 [Alteromonas sp. KUL17]|uniref:reverse transcriptase domain-containing protein n=1 Tax=Alteromonas sp. KUL17 TaxID=2480796 RepID=UPI001037C070|nr:reverse transcriptase domain-containing protein [Alteromonas sp. KUL17]TAP29747.1 RNA-directed DNA polymerase [Alteromonas sp. KUL17]GEA02141.1 hypothetical protein KUL17_10380 [Alteromonas sp. KUL17]
MTHEADSNQTKKKTLEQAFNTIFHDKEDFSEFCSLDVISEVEPFTISDREVFKTSDRLKRYLRFIDRIILRHLSIDTDVVHSFSQEKNTYTAVKEHVGNDYFFLTDIESFFSKIKTEDVKKILYRNINNIPISDIENYIDFLSSVVSFNNQLPVGFSTSPRLSNSFLYDFDIALKTYCSRESLTYTRYADDVIISGASFEKLERLKTTIQDFLKIHASNELRLNKSKTRITHLGNKVKILGLMILPNRTITIDAKYKSRLELLLHFYSNNKEKYQSYLEENFNGSEKSVFGMLHYVQSIDPDYLDKLQRKYGIYAVRFFMEKKSNDNR